MVMLIEVSENSKTWNINLSTNHCAFPKNLLQGIPVLLITCLLIYFKYFPSILLIYIIFEDSNVKQR